MTSRISLETGGWFDMDATRQKFSEHTRFDGSNYISCATGSQWEHEALYLTAKGAWVLNRWSQYQGVLETWRTVTPEVATQWLIENGHELPEELSEVADSTEV